MSIVLKKRRLQSGLFGRYFNTYFSDNMGNLTTPTNTDVQTQLEQQTLGYLEATFWQIRQRQTGNLEHHQTTHLLFGLDLTLRRWTQI